MKKAILGSLYFVPVLAFAQNLGGLVTLVQQMQTVLNNIYPFLFGLAIIYFFWGVAKYILSAGDPKAAAEGRSIMIWGIVALAVMASIYGLIYFLQNSFGVNTNNTTVTLPPLP
jgi:Type IV secretion system pilin